MTAEDATRSRESLRILRVASDTYPEVSGGLGLHVHHLSRAQAERGHDVVVLTADRGEESSPVRRERAGYTLRYHTELAAPLGNSICPSLARSLYQMADEFDVIHAHSHLFFSTNLAALISKFTDTPLVITNHGVHSQTAPLWLQKVYLPAVGRYTLQAADTVICYTRTDSERLSDLGVDTQRAVIHNGIDCSTFQPAAGTAEKDQLLYVGRLKEAKGVHHLVRAFARLREDYPEYELKLVGDGPLRDDLESLAASLDVRDGVTFAGRVPNEQLPQVYSESAAMVLPSRNEGMPRTVLEALACETPAVTSELPQLEPVLSDGGVMVSDPDADSLARALSGLLDDDARRRRMGKLGRERVTEHHSWETAVTETLDEYYRLLDAQSHATGDDRRSVAIEEAPST